MGGLVPTSADPTGVFVLRNEPASIANSVLGRNDLEGAQRMVYVLDLTQPNGLFLALIHISEPTRLRRISYAVFRLKKKKKKKRHTTTKKTLVSTNTHHKN